MNSFSWRWVATLLAAGWLAGGWPARAQAPDASAVETGMPPPVEVYKGRRVARTMHYSGASWLVRESRQREEDCERMLGALGLKEGQTVCDLGCGNGFYSLPMARQVGDKGEVISVDIQPEMLTLLRERARKEGVTNIRPRLGSVIDPKLKDESVDMVLLVDVYHEFSHPEHMLRAIRKALKPDGRMVLVEFRAEDPAVPILEEHKMSKAQILKEIPPLGFKLVEQFDELPWQHMMFFQRDE